MPVCSVCGSQYSFLKKSCPECAKALAIVPPSQMSLYVNDPVGLIIHQVQTGQYMPIPTTINLQRGEVVLFTTPVTLAEDKTSSKRVGGSSGISVPIGHGVRVRAGSYQSHTVKKTQLTKIEQGHFTITTKRLVFTGARNSIVLQLNKILNTMIYKDGVEIRVENRQKREVFLCEGPKLLYDYILAAIQLSSPK